MPPERCVCDDIELDWVSVGCLGVAFHMDGVNHAVAVYCHEVAPVPQPCCCWCIYAAQWWEGPAPPGGDPPDNQEYFALHNIEKLPPWHTENLGAPFPSGVIVIPPPCFHQELSAWVGTAANGYEPLPE